jgi:hypothetical protein
MRQNHPMASSADDEEFGWDPARRAGDLDDVPSFSIEGAMFEEEATPPEILAIGPPPQDAAAIQKWQYQMLSTMAWLVMNDTRLPMERRQKKFADLSQAAARHYPEAARWDLSQKIQKDAEDTAGRKRAKAAARLERAPAAGGAKVIPIRKDAAVE